jgi:hypothetical protein
MSARALLAPVVAVAALVGLGIAGSRAEEPAGQLAALRGSSAPVDVATLVCPAVTGTPAGLVTTMSVADLGAALSGGPARVAVSGIPLTGVDPKLGAPTPPTSPRLVLAANPVATVRRTTPYAAVAVSLRGPGAANVAVDQVGLQSQGLGRAASDSSCLPPAGDWWFAGADGRVGFSDALLLANPTDTVANVAITGWSQAGALRLAGLDALTVPPRSVLGLKVASFAPNAADVAVHVHAVSGSLVAALTDRRVHGIHPAGSDWLPPTAPPSPGLVVAGLPGGAGSRHLYLANPGNRDATVGLRVVTRSGNFQPAGRQSLVVPAGHTADVDLSAALADEPAGVVVQSDQPVIAEGLMVAHVRGLFDDVAWLPATPPLSGPAGLAANDPPFGQDVRLVLVAPRGAVRVRVTSARGATVVLTVPAGRTLSVDPRVALHLPAGASAGALALIPLEQEPVYAARVLHASGSHGPLITAEVPLVLPAAIVLPPVVEDPRAAVR